MNVARIYLRVSTNEQDLTRQNHIIESTEAAGFYIAGVYKEKASGAVVNRPELQRMIADLQAGDVVVAEKIDRISRLPLAEAEKLIQSIRDKGAKLAIPDLVDFSELSANMTGVAKIVLDATQEMLLKIALQFSRDVYETLHERQKQGIKLAREKGLYLGRRPDTDTHATIIKLREHKVSIKETAKLAKCSEAQVKRIWSMHQAALKDAV
jgi:DNA invertase Pin-like site-specific DNA recombinase